MKCKDITPIIGCLKKADGTFQAISIHYEYGQDAAGNTILVSTTYTDALGNPITPSEGDEASPGECSKSPNNNSCWKDKFVEGGLDNTFTSFRHTNQIYTVTFDNGDIDTFTVPSATGWTDQVNQMATGLDGIMPWAITVAPFCNFPNGCGGLSAPVVELNQMFARYVGFRICPGEKIPVSVAYTSDQSTTPKNLVIQYVESDTFYYQRCLDCADDCDSEELNEVWTPLNGGTCPPICPIPCETEFPPVPTLSCQTDLQPVCDSDNPDQVVYAVFQDCGGGQIFTGYYTPDPDDPNALIDYELQGELNGEGCAPCEFTGSLILCDPNTCDKYEVKSYSNCPTEILLYGTNIPASPKGDLVECIDKNIISEKCFKSQLFYYEWDNGYVGYRPNIDTQPGVYNTPHGSVLLLNGELPTTYKGVIDRLLTCGTATIDQININGVDLLTNPVVETTTTGTWIPLSNLLYDTITANSQYNLPAGRGCDLPPVTPSANCFGRSISCDDIPADENGNIGYFDVTDCKGQTWRFSIRKTAQPESRYTGLQYFDCKGELICEYFDDNKQPVVLDDECLTEVCCTKCGEGLDQAILDKLCEIAELLTVEPGCDEKCESAPFCVRGFDYQNLNSWEEGSMEWETPAGTSVDQPSSQDDGGKASWYTNLIANVNSNAGWTMSVATDVDSSEQGPKPVFQFVGPCESELVIVRNGGDTMTLTVDDQGVMTGTFTESGNNIESETFVQCPDFDVPEDCSQFNTDYLALENTTDIDFSSTSNTLNWNISTGANTQGAVDFTQAIMDCIDAGGTAKILIVDFGNNSYEFLATSYQGTSSVGGNATFSGTGDAVNRAKIAESILECNCE